MRALLDDPALVEDKDLVRAHNGAEPVRHNETGAASEQTSKGMLQAVLGDRVNCARGLVEDEDARVGQ